MTKFYFGKTWETTRKTWENMQKNGKALDDKVFLGENMGKHLENMEKHAKTRENNKNIGKY
jgi:hypothetical protein